MMSLSCGETKTFLQKKKITPLGSMNAFKIKKSLTEKKEERKLFFALLASSSLVLRKIRKLFVVQHQQCYISWDGIK